MNFKNKKLIRLLVSALIFTFLTAFTSEYTRKVDPLPNMPKGNPDPSLGIVIHPDSTGVDVLRDSSQNIRFVATKNFYKTHIAMLGSSSMVDRTPKKIKFDDKKHGFSSDNIYEFSMMFNRKNHQWSFIRFMPFPSVIEWVTEDKLKIYVNQWVKKMEDAGWKRMEYTRAEEPQRIHNFRIPTHKFNNLTTEYCSWTTNEYEAVIELTIRPRDDYKYYVPKAHRSNITNVPDGFLVFIKITKNSQFDI